jgi:membrane-associated protease RseP (regulator of RpoE activity)
LQEATVENRWLLDAGFSQERIDWFVRRKKELLAQRQQETEQRKLAGALPDPSGGAWMLDNDLLLRDEMDNEEYVKYRQALRKTTAVGVDNVVQGSNASNAGLLPGDQIVRYDGKRVFSDLELRSLARSTNGNQIAQVEVLRDGRSLTMVMPGGEIGIARTAESRLSDITRRAIAVAREGRSSPGANQ